eukprot:1662214-Pleurochrysis_carterae.AAC.1
MGTRTLVTTSTQTSLVLPQSLLNDAAARKGQVRPSIDSLVEALNTRELNHPYQETVDSMRSTWPTPASVQQCASAVTLTMHPTNYRTQDAQVHILVGQQ